MIMGKLRTLSCCYLALSRKTHFFLPLILLFIHLILLINLRFEAWPEMLVYPYLMNRGFLLYRDIINPYPPLLNGFLSLVFTLVPISINNLKVITWLIILFSDLLIYLIAKKRYGSTSALIALAFFIVFQPLLDGNGLWFDLALVPLLLLAFNRQSTLALTISFFIKQSVIWLLPLFIRQWKKLLLFFLILSISSFIPFLILGIHRDYWFWSWRFPFTIFPFMPGHKDFGNIRLWVLAVLPFMLPIYLWFKKNSTIKLSAHEPIVWCLLSFPFIFPRFGLFHLQPALAFAALSVARSVKKLPLIEIPRNHWLKFFAVTFSLLASLMWIRHIRLYWHQSVRFFEPEIIAAASKLQQFTNAYQPILFLNSPAQLMVLTNRLPARPWADTFPWYLELPHFQSQLLDSYRQQNVQGVIFSAYQDQDKFDPGTYKPEILNLYAQENFSHQDFLTKSIFLLTP